MIETGVKVNTRRERLKNPSPCRAEAVLNVSEICGAVVASVCTNCEPCNWNAETSLDTNGSGTDFDEVVDDVRRRAVEGFEAMCPLLD